MGNSRSKLNQGEFSSISKYVNPAMLPPVGLPPVLRNVPGPKQDHAFNIILDDHTLFDSEYYLPNALNVSEHAINELLVPVYGLDRHIEVLCQTKKKDTQRPPAAVKEYFFTTHIITPYNCPPWSSATNDELLEMVGEGSEQRGNYSAKVKVGVMLSSAIEIEIPPPIARLYPSNLTNDDYVVFSFPWNAYLQPRLGRAMFPLDWSSTAFVQNNNEIITPENDSPGLISPHPVRSDAIYNPSYRYSPMFKLTPCNQLQSMDPTVSRLGHVEPIGCFIVVVDFEDTQSTLTGYGFLNHVISAMLSGSIVDLKNIPVFLFFYNSVQLDSFDYTFDGDDEQKWIAKIVQDGLTSALIPRDGGPKAKPQIFQAVLEMLGWNPDIIITSHLSNPPMQSLKESKKPLKTITISAKTTTTTATTITTTTTPSPTTSLDSLDPFNLLSPTATPDDSTITTAPLRDFHQESYDAIMSVLFKHFMLIPQFCRGSMFTPSRTRPTPFSSHFSTIPRVQHRLLPRPYPYLPFPLPQVGFNAQSGFSISARSGSQLVTVEARFLQMVKTWFAKRTLSAMFVVNENYRAPCDEFPTQSSYQPTDREHGNTGLGLWVDASYPCKMGRTELSWEADVEMFKQQNQDRQQLRLSLLQKQFKNDLNHSSDHRTDTTIHEQFINGQEMIYGAIRVMTESERKKARKQRQGPFDRRHAEAYAKFATLGSHHSCHPVAFPSDGCPDPDGIDLQTNAQDLIDLRKSIDAHGWYSSVPPTRTQIMLLANSLWDPNQVEKKDDDNDEDDSRNGLHCKVKYSSIPPPYSTSPLNPSQLRVATTISVCDTKNTTFMVNLVPYSSNNIDLQLMQRAMWAKIAKNQCGILLKTRHVQVDGDDESAKIERGLDPSEYIEPLTLLNQQRLVDAAMSSTINRTIQNQILNGFDYIRVFDGYAEGIADRVWDEGLNANHFHRPLNLLKTSALFLEYPIYNIVLPHCGFDANVSRKDHKVQRPNPSWEDEDAVERDSKANQVLTESEQFDIKVKQRFARMAYLEHWDEQVNAILYRQGRVINPTLMTDDELSATPLTTAEAKILFYNTYVTNIVTAREELSVARVWIEQDALRRKFSTMWRRAIADHDHKVEVVDEVGTESSRGGLSGVKT